MNEFFKITKGKLIAFGVLLLLAIYLWVPAPYAGNIVQFLGVFGEILGKISIMINFPIVFLYGIFYKYNLVFFLLTLIYNYVIICLVAKIFKKYNPDLRLFLIIFVILEILAYVIGSFYTWRAECLPCRIGHECPPCPSGNYANFFLLAGMIPNLILSFVISTLIKKYKKRK
ncbi:hypothetical protein FJZ18_01135 [Candidatus Pacearchaeota archaeon]|nr:hypothetical protein [Candidatus Pacearchaeota archaeon]